MSRAKVAECGTVSGYTKHSRSGTQPCAACVAAWNDYQYGYRARKAGHVRVVIKLADVLTIAKALHFYHRYLRSTQASHIAGAPREAAASTRLRDEFAGTVRLIQGGRS